MGLLAGLDIGGDVIRADRAKGQAVLITPGEEFAARTGIGPGRLFGLRMLAVKKVDVAPSGLLAGDGDQYRDEICVGQPVGHGGRLGKTRKSRTVMILVPA